MPLSRYQIRNEYSLADPELYTAADKDDPEALLEGIAMAGLVGVLRQLGDLAEFAAEIFHDLHEQVMATASRGHSLMVRVQQLEEEFPTIEKAFLSQTNHSSFYYNYGIDWHPNLHMDQNVITQGDLPRFVMDSYEECRGPPRLFLLDKFDVAGAGACLKRYTDPSFFKLETSYPDTIRDKKFRKAKRRGPRWKNGETPETLSTSHAKLHQLFLQERIENGTLNSAGRVKLKRRLNGFPFDTKPGKSYMEKFLKPPSPDHDEVHFTLEDLSTQPPNSTYESTCEVVEISVISPEKKPKQLTRSVSPAREETTLELAEGELNEVSSSGEGSVHEKPKLGFQTYEISSPSRLRENEISVDGSSETEDSMDENQSDDVASEIDNFVDALATMDSDIETDSDLRSKTDLPSVSSRGPTSNVDDANDVMDQAHSAESLSSGNSSVSDDGSSSSKKELCSFSYSDAYSTSAENTPFDREVSSNAMTSKIHEADPSLIQQSVDPDREVSAPLEETAYDGVSTVPDVVPVNAFQLDVPIGSSTPKNSVLLHENAEAVAKDTASVSSDIGDMEVPSSSDICKQKGDSLPAKSVEVSDDYENVDVTKIDDIGLTSLSIPFVSRYDLPWQVQSENQFVNEADDEAVNQDENAEIEPLNELLDEEKPFNVTDFSDMFLYIGDQASPAISSKNLPLNGFGVKGPNDDLNISVTVSVVGASAEKNVTENLLQISHTEDGSLKNIDVLQNSDLQLSEEHLSNSAHEEHEMHCLGIEVGEIVSEVDNSIPAAEAPVSYELLASCNPRMEADAQPLDLVGGQTLPLTEECCDEPLSVGDGGTINEEASSYSGLIENNGTSVHEHLTEVEDEYATATATIAAPDHENDGVPFDDLKDLKVASLSSFRKEHSGLEVDTSSSNKLANSSVFDDVDNLHDTVVTDSLGPQTSENDGHPVSGRENGLNIDEMPTTQKFTLASKDNFQDAVTDDDIGSQISVDDGRHLVTGEENGLNFDETPTTLKLTSGGENEPNTAKTSIPSSIGEQYEYDPHHLEEDIDLQPNQTGSNVPCKSDDDLPLSTGLQRELVSDHDNHLRTFDAYESSVKNISRQSSASEQLSHGSKKIDFTEQYLGPPNPSSLPFSVLPDPGQIFLEEMPPVPPLPPVQWRLGKFQNAFPVRDSILGSSSANIAFPSPALSSIVKEETHNLHSFLPQTALPDEKSTPLPEQSLDCSINSILPPEVEPGEQKNDILPPEMYLGTGTLPQSPRSQSEKEAGELKVTMDSFDQTYVMTDGAHLPSSSHEERIRPHNQVVRETIASHMELAVHSGENMVTCDTSEVSVKVPNENLITTSGGHLSPPSAEDGIINMNRKLKLPRPRNPLIDAVVALDKSKLRKVPERIKPQVEKQDERDSLLQLRKVPERIKPLLKKDDERDSLLQLRKVPERTKPPVQKDDERDSWLEQIRTKSFNLKPAVVTRPSIQQGPNTNLRVAAILEKAKTIRQAFAGSDEEDDNDSWSDS